MKNIILFTITFIILFYGLWITKAIAWENNKTHPAITQKATDNSVLDVYLQNQLEMSQGVDTLLELPESYRDELITRAGQVRPK